MEALVTYFAEMPEAYRAIFPFVVLLFCWIVEPFAPVKRMQYAKVRHGAVNLTLFATNAVIIVLMLATIGVVMFWATENQFGLLYRVDLPLWVELLLSLMILDFIGQYVMHYLLHHVQWMWRLHMVHHSDPHVDATTGTRHHAFDLLLREFAIVTTVVLVGIPFVFYVIYRFIAVFFTYTIHGNLRIPRALDRLLVLVFVTPDMHKFHHHKEAPWTDSNFGAILSIWDRMFGTYVYEDTNDIEYGLDVLEDERALELKYLYLLPWSKAVSGNGRPGLFQRYLPDSRLG